jgi:hypothetical protein
MKHGANTKNFDKFCLFHHDIEHDIEDYYVMKKEEDKKTTC